MRRYHKSQLALCIQALLFGSILLPKVTIAAEEAQEDVAKKSSGIEVIEVSYGYGSVKKEDLTGAVSTVELEDVADLPAGNIMQNLQGRVPGLQITTNGSPESTATVRIRGQGLGPLGNNDPLYVVDGIPTKSGMHELNSHDIADIQVLRDAAAASIFGARSGNGVIVITTKKGQEGLNFDFSFNQSYDDFDYDLNPLNTQQRGEAVWRAAVNDGSDPNAASPLYSFDWNGDFNNPQLNGISLPTYTDPNQVQRPADTNWFNEVTRSAKVTDINFSLSGGSDRASVYSSLGYFNSEGVVDGSEFERINFRVNSEFQVTDKLRIGENFTITNQESNLVNTLAGQILGLAIEQQSIVPVYNDEGGWGGPVPGVTDRDNPVRIIEMNRDNVSRFNKVMGNIFVEYEPVEDLTLKSSLGIDYGQYYFRNFTRAFQAGSLNFGDQLSVTDNWNRSITWTNTAEYKFDINDLHQFTVLAGTEQIDYEYEGVVGFGSGFASDERNYAHLSQATGDVRVEGDGDKWSLNSYFARLDYNYDNRYLAGLTIRRDGSSRFGSNNRYGNFPAISAGWVVSNESFYDLEFLSTLKFRASWGKTGNQEIPTDATYTTYLSRYATQSLFTDRQDEGTAYDITGANGGNLPSGFVKAQTGNPDLKWETSTQTNFGIDFGMRYDTIYGSLDWFEKTTDDILTLTNPIATLGEGAQKWVNGGTIENSGIEFIVGYADYLTFDSLDGDIDVDVSFNVSSAKNKVVSLPEDVVNSFGGNGTDKTILGHSINSIYGYVADGLFQSQAEIDAHATQAGAGLGRVRWKDLDGNGVIDEDDQMFFADTDPDYTYGFNLSLKYKNWDFNMFWQGVEGGQIRNGWRGFTDFTSLNIGSNYGDRVLNAWTVDNTDSNVPALTLIDNNGEGRQSSLFWEEGTYLKLRNLSIGYTPDEQWLNQYGISSARIYLQGSNLITITPSGTLSQDPETPDGNFPIPRRITLGVNLSF
ncbi:SusC/RagA family TonB-linked outer membrane protein [Pseudoalteromonas lipolytica]|uniref:SusC/RagA family TonB-linked outer membrane protein n=1 Tax=Pseudoalteromonas lipolytica TaxID=570156 RepID=A0AAD0RYA3_9GAMM|nr:MULTISPECIES: SusC/RagA family TonB-linked outer membrane protein [Pseudoalteromonas]AXV64820.1 SusC/RagA family TonB-linked outer membrane protein [Pseudoalteromonas donghaensis]QPL43915.1 SusC/RagA family TonB-linked outer membrane protein [Pseudoalteromonas sp. A41-2]